MGQRQGQLGNNYDYDDRSEVSSVPSKVSVIKMKYDIYIKALTADKAPCAFYRNKFCESFKLHPTLLSIVVNRIYFL